MSQMLQIVQIILQQEDTLVEEISPYINSIEFITIATLGNSQEFGDFTTQIARD